VDALTGSRPHPTLAGVRAILFDKDGTLLDFDATWGPAAAEVLGTLAGGDRDVMRDLAASCGFDPQTDRFLPDSPIIGGYTAEFTPAWAARLGVPHDEAFIRQVDGLFRPASLRHLTAYDDVAEGLARLRDAGLPIGLATNDAEANAHAHLGKLGIAPFFGFVCGYDSGHGGKPGGGMARAFAAHAGVPVEAVALIGDTPHDMHEAAAAGAVGVGIARSERARRALGALPPLVVADMAELSKALGL
jgi:phosphoglycolate phosphatase